MPRGRPRLQASYDGDSDSACSSSASSSGDDLNARGAPGDSAAKSARQRTGGPGKGVQAKEKDFDASDAANKVKRSPSGGQASGQGDGRSLKLVQKRSPLLVLPVELFSEICSHADTAGLLSLSKTCQNLRATLVGPQSTPLWRIVRERRKLPLPSDMTERQFADLLHGSTCFACGETCDAEPDFFLGCRLCKRCRRNEVIEDSTMRNGETQRLARTAVRCRRTRLLSTQFTSSRIEYLERDLLEAVDAIVDLSAQDEVAQQAIDKWWDKESKNSRLGSRTSRRRLLEQLTEMIEEEAELAAKFAKEEQKRKADQKKRELEELDAHLVLDHDWTTQQLRWLCKHRHHERAPRTYSEQHVAAWDEFRAVVQEELDRKADEAAAGAARLARRDKLAPRRKAFAKSQGSRATLVPRFSTFADWPAVKPLWEPADAPPVSDEWWERVLPTVRLDFDAYLSELRVEAIRAILSATTGAPLDTLSTDAAAYPEDKYDEYWFERPSALFLGERKIGPSGRIEVVPLPFPETLAEHRAKTGDRKAWFAQHIDEHRVRLVRLILDAVGETEDSVTSRGLDAYGAGFVWLDAPYVQAKHRDRRYNWVELVLALKRRGPKLRDLKAGKNGPKIALWSDEDSDIAQGDDERSEKGSEYGDGSG
ncbi:hypothetical protein DMC30DRAFT_418789 [Rhodotorula diobovata]|uniref:F-box domain-containing protein n=1 Tax=Rhodotorula diobovata TaxID=5288 RepID=A0A5C5FQ86_9BASI|nr:hypothetical protein DMC30DRAFT_418789 [Rhodotorula diobovata]